MVSSVEHQVLYALKSTFKDKEDAYQYFTALLHNMDYLITRNKKDFQKHPTAIPVFTPSEFLQQQLK
ncbi:MAG: hypothetical protein AAF789_01845 [Bacteroidota bacterium]